MSWRQMPIATGDQQTGPAIDDVARRLLELCFDDDVITDDSSSIASLLSCSREASDRLQATVFGMARRDPALRDRLAVLVTASIAAINSTDDAPVLVRKAGA